MGTHNPGNKKPYNKLWAVLSVDKNGNEGTCAINSPIGPQVAITGEPRLLELFKKEILTEQAKAKAREVGVKIVIGEFTRTNTEII